MARWLCNIWSPSSKTNLKLKGGSSRFWTPSTTLWPYNKLLADLNDSGFKSGRSCGAEINTLHIVVEQNNAFWSPLYILCVDFKNAFNSMNRDFMWTTLASNSFPIKLLNIIKELYRDCVCKVKHDGLTRVSFSVTSDVLYWIMLLQPQISNFLLRGGWFKAVGLEAS